MQRPAEHGACDLAAGGGSTGTPTPNLAPLVCRTLARG